MGFSLTPLSIQGQAT